MLCMLLHQKCNRGTEKQAAFRKARASAQASDREGYCQCAATSIANAAATAIANEVSLSYARRHQALISCSALLFVLASIFMLNTGTEWLVDASGCRQAALADVEALRAVFARIITEMNLRTVGEALWHRFDGAGGVTGMVMLSESHLTCHTYPEYSFATFNLYCCRVRPAWPWAERLSEMIGAGRVTVRAIERHVPADDAQQSSVQMFEPSSIADLSSNLSPDFPPELSPELSRIGELSLVESSLIEHSLIEPSAVEPSSIAGRRGGERG